jgi:ribosomal protein S18 acetylase RimI-like enzyme
LESSTERTLEVQERIQAYLRAVAPLGREVERVGPFLATYTADSPNPFLNYAIPDDGAVPSPEEVAALVGAFARRRRRPRLEYVGDQAPAVEDALLGAGFLVEGRLVLMAFDPSREAPGLPPGIALVSPQSDEDLYGMAVAQAEAYGDAAPGPDVVRGRREALAAGSLAVVARSHDSSRIIGAGSCSPVRDGLCEVAGIGVAPGYRRQGIAAGLAHRLALEAVSAGAEAPWLMAVDGAERRVYERAGFTVVGAILHVSMPTGGPWA